MAVDAPHIQLQLRGWIMTAADHIQARKEKLALSSFRAASLWRRRESRHLEWIKDRAALEVRAFLAAGLRQHATSRNGT